MRFIKKFFKVFSTRRDEAMIVCLELNLSLTEENISKVEELIRKKNFGELGNLKQN